MLCHSAWHTKCLSFSHTIIFSCVHFSLSTLHLFSCVHFSLSSLHQLEWLANLQQSPVPLQFLLPEVVIATDATPTHWAFYFQGLGYPYQLVVPGQVPCLGLMLPCRNFMLMLSCYVGWPSASQVRWWPCTWITALLRLIFVIKVVQCLLFFPGWPARY